MPSDGDTQLALEQCFLRWHTPHQRQCGQCLAKFVRTLTVPLPRTELGEPDSDLV
jgi:hypothetical protein